MGALILNTLGCSLLYHPVERHMKVIPIDDDQMDGEAHLEKEFGMDNPGLSMQDEAGDAAIRNGIKDEDTNGRQRIDSMDHHDRHPRASQCSMVSIVDPPPNVLLPVSLCNPEKAVVNCKEDEPPLMESKRFDFGILRDPIYLVILISNSTSAISNTNFMILLPSYAISQGFDNNVSALLLSIVSFLDLVGRIGGASLSDIDFIPKYYYFVGGLGLSGVALALLPMANTYTMLAVFCGFFGLTSGIYIGITAVILADMLGAEKLASSYGISLFVNGLLQLVGPPVCNCLFEQIGTYKPIFLGLGIILILGSALWIVVPIILRNKKNAAAGKGKV